MKKTLLLSLIIPFLFFVACPTDNGSSGVSVTGVTLDRDAITLTVGASETLYATVAPPDATNSDVTWTSGRAAVATVTNGTVTARGPGTATITVTTADGEKTARCTVTVIIGGLSDQTAAEYFSAKNLFLGWNVGNSLDAPVLESGWGNPEINQALLDGVKRAGFNVVRIPITWHNNALRPIGPAPEYALNEERLDRVAQVVDMAYKAGLAVIINTHHDSTPSHAESYWLNIKTAGESTESYTEITAKFTKVWEQIATRFRYYGDWLIFESFNEPHNAVQGQGAWGWGNVPARELEIINEWNQVFTDVVRTSGGCNAERFLVIQPYNARVHQAVADTFVLPTDTIAGKQIVSMHWYYPDNFALNGRSPDWGTDADKDAIINGSTAAPNNTNGVGFKHFKEKYTDKGIPVIMGECGATYQNRQGEEGEKADANRLAYLTFLCDQAKAHGLVPVLWDNGRNTGGPNDRGEMFGLFDRYTGEPLGERESALIEAMVNAVN